MRGFTAAVGCAGVQPPELCSAVLPYTLSKRCVSVLQTLWLCDRFCSSAVVKLRGRGLAFAMDAYTRAARMSVVRCVVAFIGKLALLGLAGDDHTASLTAAPSRLSHNLHFTVCVRKLLARMCFRVPVSTTVHICVTVGAHRPFHRSFCCTMCNVPYRLATSERARRGKGEIFSVAAEFG